MSEVFAGSATLKKPHAASNATGERRLGLIVGEPIYAYLAQAAEAAGADIPEILRRAVGLHMAATKARDDGKSVAVLGPDGEPETELVGY